MKNSFIGIEDWMFRELNLTGSELLVFALIYSFSRSGVYYGGHPYALSFLGISKGTFFRSIKKLLEKDLITKSSDARGFIASPKMKLRVSKWNSSEYQNETNEYQNETHIYNIYKYINNIYTEFDGLKINCFEVFLKNTINRNFSQIETFLKDYSSVLTKIQIKKFDPNRELCVAWHWHQNKLLETREPQFMPNPQKWLLNDAVSCVNKNRKTKFYTNKKIDSIFRKLYKA